MTIKLSTKEISALFTSMTQDVCKEIGIEYEEDGVDGIAINFILEAVGDKLYRVRKEKERLKH